MNVEQKIVFEQPRTIDERTEIARACVLHLNFAMPMLLDEMSNAVDIAYAALPERLYVIDRDGRIAWRSGPGPWGFDVDGWEKAIEAQLR
jgi:type I thyroxine 5'-deiodinase